MDAIIGRPNIRIEIQNNLVEPMEVDSEEKLAISECEDGEITETNDICEKKKVVESKQTNNNRSWSHPNGGFTTGVDIFDKKEQEKLQERANRFGLKPTEVTNFTDEQLKQLHISLGITSNNEKTVRLEAIHMRGTDEMSTEDIFEYFGKYGPAYVEWISDESCNVIWHDKVSAARALHFTSKPIKDMPAEGACNPFSKDGFDAEETNEGRSILLVNKNREVSFDNEGGDLASTEEPVNISDVKIPVPPGHWRLGLEHPKTKGVLLRFAFKTDKKPMKAERFSEYYKKYGNPNFGGMKGIISESCRKKFKGIFDRNKDINKKSTIIEDNKNPWGDLAENWDLDELFSERVHPSNTTHQNDNDKDMPDVIKRLGVKRNCDSDKEVSDEKKDVSRKKSKIPRMRMYADEEEEKMKRKKQMLALKLNKPVIEKVHTQPQDLRKILGTISKSKKQQIYVEQADSKDLGAKLKNRSRTNEDLRFKSDSIKTVAKSTEILVRESYRSSPSDVRISTHSSESSSLYKKSNQHDYDRLRYRNKLHSDRYRRHRRRSSDEEGLNRHKTKSKIAVVIKQQQRPAVASTIWSRIMAKKERLKTASERLQPRQESSSSSESTSDSNSSSSSEGSSSDSSSESGDESNVTRQYIKQDSGVYNESKAVQLINRPGFRNDLQPSLTVTNAKSLLRIEINNDRFKEE